MKVESVQSAYCKPTAKNSVKVKSENSASVAKKASPSFKSWGEDYPDYPVYPGGGPSEGVCKPKIRASQALANQSLALQSKLQSLRTHQRARAKLVAPEKIQAATNQVRKHPKVLVP